jgi:6-pyruvoyltetrahydropterin/6-carboxytetrahydropterin synthase
VKLFGKCNNPHGHGHNYTLEVTVSGPTDPHSGMIIARTQLDDIVERCILSEIDHTDLNSDIEELSNTPTTTENLALFISHRLDKFWSQKFTPTGPRVTRIKVEETARNSFEVIF